MSRAIARLAAAAALGALAAAAFAPVHAVLALAIGTVGLMLLADRRRTAAGAFGIGFVYGLGHFAAGLYWVGNALAVAGILPWAAPFAVAGLAAACALFVGFSCAVYRFLAPRGAWRPLVFASAWVLGEWLRGTLAFGGFPWNLAGYVWTPWPAMLQFAAAAGVYGLGWLTMLAAAAPAALADGRRLWWTPVGALALLAVNAAAGAAILAGADAVPHTDTRLRLVQANVAQHHKGRADLIEAQIRRHAALSARPGAGGAAPPPTFVVWPETAVPYDLSRPFPAREAVARVVPEGGALVAGALRSEAAPDGRRVWNALQALDSEGRVAAAYDKFHLVPFGEYVPLRGLLPGGGLAAGALDFSRGPGPRTLSVPGAPPFAPLICYEAIFPGAVVDPAARPQWLLNVTNDAWYGLSSGPYQHFEQTRLRAVEEGLPLVRAANTGISGVIDAWGRVTAKSPLGEPAILDAPLPPPRPAPTPFSRLGNAPALALSLAPLAAFAARRRLKRATP